MDKSPDAFRTISEAAEELDLPQHVLRFWETRFSTIKPLKRGGGRRYYRPEDVLLLKGIRHLLYDQGFTIKGVQRILKDQGTRYVAAIGNGGPIGALPSPSDDDLDTEGEELHVNGAEPPESGAAGISSADRQRLSAVLRDLLDMKRILERARE
jgi:DNA-binding transcriptional MerR regulator